MYEYILFRGSDIKDIRVINSVPVPNDPAIMQMHLPPTVQSFPNGQYAGNIHMGTPMAGQSFGNLYTPMSTSFTGQNLAPGAGSLNKSKQSSELNIAIPESSSTTQQLLDQGVMVNFDLEVANHAVAICLVWIFIYLLAISIFA